MKLEKEVEIGNIYKAIYGDGTCGVSFNCMVLNSLNREETNIFEEITFKGRAKLTLEVEKSILDEQERKYLRGVIKPFRDRITSIALEDIDDTELLQMIIYYDDNIASFPLPPFKIGTMYKNMELNKQYTLEELWL